MIALDERTPGVADIGVAGRGFQPEEESGVAEVCLVVEEAVLAIKGGIAETLKIGRLDVGNEGGLIRGDPAVSVPSVTRRFDESPGFARCGRFEANTAEPRAPDIGEGEAGGEIVGDSIGGVEGEAGEALGAVDVVVEQGVANQIGV